MGGSQLNHPPYLQSDVSENNLNQSCCSSQVSDIEQIDGNVSLDSNSSHFSSPSPSSCRIETVISYDRQQHPSYINQPLKYPKRNLITIKRSKKVVDASVLPVVMNLNPRSLYNKQNAFRTLVEQTELGICTVSESWDRSHETGGNRLSDILNIDGYRWIQNCVQRKKKGGKPAILACEKLFHIKELSPEVITVPIGIEAVWALLIPRNTSSGSSIKQMVVASVYYSSKQTMKAVPNMAQS